MRKFTERVINFLKREDGPTAVEYAVMLALIIVVCLVAITALGTSANATFGNISAKGTLIRALSTTHTMGRIDKIASHQRIPD